MSFASQADQILTMLQTPMIGLAPVAVVSSLKRPQHAFEMLLKNLSPCSGAGVSTAQGMMYCYRIITSLGLKVELPMVLEMDNKGGVDLANNYSVGGRT